MGNTERRQEKKESQKFYKNFYHATPARLKPGDRISPTYPKKNFDGCARGVYMTPHPQPHSTVYEEAFDGDWDVYEVRPTGKVRLWEWCDYITNEEVIVVRKVGTAKGLAIPGNLTNKDRKKAEIYKDYYRECFKEAKSKLHEELNKIKPDKELIDKIKSDIKYFDFRIKYPIVKTSKIKPRSPQNIFSCKGMKNSKSLK